MSQITFEVDNSIYKNRTSLKDSYTPDEIVGRDEELKAYRDALYPIVDGEEPDNIFLYGKSGVGKTACTRYILRILENKCNEINIDLTTLAINCDACNTSYQVAIKLLNTLRPPENQLSQNGHPEWKVFEELFNELESIGGTILIVLDEIDSLRDDKLDNLFYQLPRAKSNENLNNANVGLIGISSDLTLRDKLAPDVRGTLCEKSIEFDPYTSEDLESVLNQRVNLAFHDNALNSAVVPLCSAFGAQDGGDARKALDLLREAGDLARQTTADQIVADHVHDAKDILKEEKILTSIENLSTQEKFTMYALVTLTEEGTVQPRSREIFTRYEDLVTLSNYDAVTYRQVREYLAGFNDLSLTLSQQKHGGPVEGNYRMHQLNYGTEEVAAALEETIEVIGVHDSITGLDKIQHLIN